MGAASIQQMAERVAQLMQERLGARGADLREKMQRAGRLLPRKVRQEARYIADAARLAANPRTLPDVDEARVAHAYDLCLRHLKGVGRSTAWRARMTGGAGRAGASLAIAAAIV